MDTITFEQLDILASKTPICNSKLLLAESRAVTLTVLGQSEIVDYMHKLALYL